jgi:hypothetical protein
VEWVVILDNDKQGPYQFALHWGGSSNTLQRLQCIGRLQGQNVVDLTLLSAIY